MPEISGKVRKNFDNILGKWEENELTLDEFIDQASEQLLKMPESERRAYIQSKVRSHRYDVRKAVKRKELLDEIDEDWIQKNLQEKLFRDPRIERLLEDAHEETAERYWVNRHGVLHGLTTAHNIYRLFPLVDKKVVGSDYIGEFMSKDLVLFTLLVAAYIHDVGRAYDKETHEIRPHPEILDEALESMRGLRLFEEKSVSGRQKSEIWGKVKELCYCHDRKKEPSNKVEIALLKLADALDCSKERAYSEEEKEELQDIRENSPEEMRTIVLKDECPGDYFGCRNIENVQIEWNDYTGSCDITFRYDDLAAVIPIKKVITILEASRRSGNPKVVNLYRSIRVWSKLRGDNRFPISPDPFQIVDILPGGVFKNRVFTADIRDLDGTAKVVMESQISNDNQEAGIPGYSIGLWGRGETNAEDLGLKIYEVKNNSKQGLEKEPEHVYSAKREGETYHYWLVKFNEPLPKGKDVKVRRECVWPGYCRVEDDHFMLRAYVPTEKAEIKVIFPEDIQKEQVSSAFFKVQTFEEEEVHKEKLSVESTEGSRALIHKTLPTTSEGYSYVLEWSLGLN